MVTSTKNYSANPEYKEWVNRRFRLLHSSDIKKVTTYKRGRIVYGDIVCALCGRHLSRNDYNTSRVRVRVRTFYLTTGSIVHYYICQDPRACFNHHLERTDNNGR